MGRLYIYVCVFNYVYLYKPYNHIIYSIISPSRMTSFTSPMFTPALRKHPMSNWALELQFLYPKGSTNQSASCQDRQNDAEAHLSHGKNGHKLTSCVGCVPIPSESCWIMIANYNQKLDYIPWQTNFWPKFREKKHNFMSFLIALSCLMS